MKDNDFSGMNAEQLQARYDELIAETSEEKRDALSEDDLEARIAEIEAIKAELKARKAAAEEETRRAEEAAQMDGEKIIEEDTRMSKVYTIESPEYRTGFLKTMLDQELTAEERNAVTYVATTGDGNSGNGAANALPSEMVNRIWDMIDEQHVILGDITMYRTGTIMEFVKRTAITQGDATTVNENAANNDEINTFAKVTLSGKDFSKHVNISYAMAKMSIDAFENFLVNEISERMGAALATDVISQINTDYDSTNNAVTTASAGKIAFTDVASALAKLKNADGQCTVYASHATIYKYLVGMVDTTGRPIFQPNAQAGAEGTLIGCPVKVEDGITGDVLLVGYPRQVVGNMIQDIMVESDKDIKKHVITYAGYARFECKLLAPKAFAKLTVTASQE